MRCYFDADILGLAHVVSALRSDCTFPGDAGATINRRVRPACEVRTPAAKDSVWIPITAARGWVAITRDARIQAHPGEIQAVIDHRARLITLAGAEAVTPWSQLEVLMTQWRSIERLTKVDGPFVYSVTRTGSPTRVALE